MKVIFNITENKNKATFQQEVVKINTSFNQTQNIVKPKFQVGYYPLPVGLENYYLKSETYSQTEIDNSLALKLDKGTYTGNASDLFLSDENLLQSLQNEQSARYYADQGLENSKQNKLESVSGNTGVGKTDASATEKLDIAGRVKSDGQVFNETTSAILPKEIKFKDGKFKAALADGVEKSVLLEGDIKNNIKKNAQSGNINYCGYAPFGSAESASVWTVTKITVADNGTITKQIFTNVTWSSVPF